MAERVVSPGVFTRERDLSFLPQSIGAIGAAIVGPTQKGPAFIPTQVTSFSEFKEIFGNLDDDFYTPYVAEQYLKSAGVVTIVRVLGLGGYLADTVNLQFVTMVASHSVAILAPSRGSSGAGDLSFSNITGPRHSSIIDSGSMLSHLRPATPGTAVSSSTGTWSAFELNVSGSGGINEQYSCSFDTGSKDYITKVISSSPQETQKKGGGTSSVYVYKHFPNNAMMASRSIAGEDPVQTLNTPDGLDFYSGGNSIDVLGNEASDWTGNKEYQTSRTPFIIGQKDSNGSTQKLFRIYSRSHGTNINGDFKVVFHSLKPAIDFPNSDFGTFSIEVRKNDSDDFILEQFHNLTFDPDSPNYFVKRIGDRYATIDSNGKLTYYGTLSNLSKYIRIGDYNSETSGKPNMAFVKFPDSIPMGFKALYNTVPGGTSIPSASFQLKQQNSNGVYDSGVFYGFDFITRYVKDDNASYLAPVPASTGTGSNIDFNLENMVGHDNANPNGEATFADSSETITLTNSTIGQRKFSVPFQWGFDGRNPATPNNTGPNISSTNTQGYDLSSSTSSGSLSYKRALNAISNPDEFDINLLVTPGVIHRLHPSITNHAISKIEARADALYIMDAAGYSDTVQTVIDTVKQLDTNYVATYFPWVLVPNADTSIPTWVPPSVVLPGVISYTDQVAHEWFAPAGLNRGGLTTVLQAKERLTHAERDDLYEGRINPIASFPGQGVVVFGQKTLQSKPSALDRINVRRLLIAVRKFIASSSKYLVFEQNTQALRNRFLNIVNPYLEQVQQNSGLSAFRVVMDDSNNTPDVVDRNQLVGQIFVQPTRTAEFIVLDFVVQPTGATFPE